jgi:hypothetical protein
MVRAFRPGALIADGLLPEEIRPLAPWRGLVQLVRSEWSGVGAGTAGGRP